MEWIFVVIYTVVAFFLMFIYEKVYPYEEDITLGYSDRYQRRMYNSALAVGVILWPIMLSILIIRLAIDFVKKLNQKR